MRKSVLLLFIGFFFFPCICKGFIPDKGATFVVTDGKYIPIFTREGTELEYEGGMHGTNCYALDTVLPPGTFIKVLGTKGDNIIHVFCKVSKKFSFSGFIHAVFFVSSLSPIDETRFEMFPTRDIKSVKSICEILDSYIGKEIPYGWGCNNLDEIDLSGLYVFKCMNETAGTPPAYRCVGFDCSGLLHAISSWTLPHSTSQLYDIQGVECLCELDGKSSNEELANALAKMTDTDFVVSKESGHVIVFLHGSFIEAMGMNYGIVYTDVTHAIERLRHMVNKGKVRVIRWHPELLERHAIYHLHLREISFVSMLERLPGERFSVEIFSYDHERRNPIFLPEYVC
ncbi:MAG: hypothetical protein LBB17_02220 [Puniceicoccales bacterium]|jgi:hypothetical protein|nr:hypothetical protein [Puniceicoccales bacterium]